MKRTSRETCRDGSAVGGVSVREGPSVGLLSLLLVAGTLAGCSGEDPVKPVREMSGVVEVRDESRERTTPEGVLVSALLPDLAPARMTGSDGTWVIRGLPDGEVDLTFSRQGLGLVRLFGVPSDTSGLRVVVPERSSLVLLDASATVDRGCGTSPCLDLVVRTIRTTLFPPEGSRRLLRVFIGPSETLSAREYEDTFVLVVPSDDPGLSFEDEVAVVRIQGIRGLELDTRPEDLAVLVYGATENAHLAYPGPDGETRIFPDLSADGVMAPVAGGG